MTLTGVEIGVIILNIGVAVEPFGLLEPPTLFALDFGDHMTPNGACAGASVAKVGCDLIRDDVDGVRAYLHDDTIYYVQDENVWSAFWDSPTLVNGPY